jgi:putative hydrolase of HD superfamily
MQNWQNHGEDWARHGISRQQILAKNAYMAEGSPDLWEFAQRIIDEGMGGGRDPAGPRAG